MSPITAIELVRHAITMTLMLAGPLLITGLIVGILVSLFQAVTQVQEQTLTFIPKAVCVGVVLLILLPWMLRQLIEYLTGIMRSLPMLAG
jgi:flagellar biosynthetic protein FliQ